MTCRSNVHKRWTSITTPITMSISGHHCRSRGPSCGIQPRFDSKKSAPTMIKIKAPVRDLNGMFLLREMVRFSSHALPQQARARIVRQSSLTASPAEHHTG